MDKSVFNTDYRIGDRVWIVTEYMGEVSVYSDEIDSINLGRDYNDKDKIALTFWMKESDGDEITEDMLVPYEDSEGLYDKIVEIENNYNSNKETAEKFDTKRKNEMKELEYQNRED